MNTGMFFNMKDYKIRKLVVIFNAINVMNMFSLFKFSSNMFFHYEAVFFDAFIVSFKNLVSVVVDCSCSVFSSPQLKGTKLAKAIIMLGTQSFTKDWLRTIGYITDFIFPEVLRNFFVYHRLYYNMEGI